MEIVNGYAATTREPFNVALQNAVHNALVRRVTSSLP